MSAEEARKQAILYVEEREALYQQAIEAGYTVTDKEVYDYLEELKQFINQSENKEDAMAIIEQFDSEEEVTGMISSKNFYRKKICRYRSIWQQRKKSLKKLRHRQKA